VLRGGGRLFIGPQAIFDDFYGGNVPPTSISSTGRRPRAAPRAAATWAGPPAKPSRRSSIRAETSSSPGST